MIEEEKSPSPAAMDDNKSSDKLDRLGRRTKEGFRRVAEDIDGLQERMCVMEDTIVDLQNQVRHLEGLLGTARPRSPASDPASNPAHGERASSQSGLISSRSRAICPAN
jgi:hypothetical protein